MKSNHRCFVGFRRQWKSEYCFAIHSAREKHDVGNFFSFNSVRRQKARCVNIPRVKQRRCVELTVTGMWQGSCWINDKQRYPFITDRDLDVCNSHYPQRRSLFHTFVSDLRSPPISLAELIGVSVIHVVVHVQGGPDRRSDHWFVLDNDSLG